ncbi:hypothetical protein F4819DRAFT_441425 [Hypoxylon fuscum]|nr:hypothetical protein F4819DRAFT_441425 [Hypoxylon fuscum]
MAIKVLMLIYRKPDLTPAEFRKHYEDVHMPLTKKVAGDTFPLSHTRRYIPRATTPQDLSATTEKYPPVVLGGNPADVGVDCVTELVFRDKKHMQLYFEMPHSPGAAAKLEEEADNFAAKYPTVLIEDCAETTPDRKPRSNFWNLFRWRR